VWCEVHTENDLTARHGAEQVLFDDKNTVVFKQIAK
jgi:hypothetical protein